MSATTTGFSVALLIVVVAAVLVAAQGGADFQTAFVAAARTVASAGSADPPIVVSVIVPSGEAAIPLCNFAARSGVDPDIRVISARATAAFE